MPSGFDPKKLSVEKYLPFALAEAKKLVPDAVLFRIDADGVFPDGHADITLTDHGSLDFRFISPAHAKPDPSLPVGAKQDYKCMFRVQLDNEGAWSAPINGWECKEPLLGPPKCTTVEVWKKALARVRRPTRSPSSAIAVGRTRRSGTSRSTAPSSAKSSTTIAASECRTAAQLKCCGAVVSPD